MVIPSNEKSWNVSNVIEICSLLLKAGADIYIQDHLSYTPLHHAVDSPNPEIVEFLIKQGVDLSITTDKGNTPLHTAMHGGEIKTLELLLDNGADINARNNFERTPLFEAKRYMKDEYTTETRQKEIIMFLESRGADEF